MANQTNVGQSRARWWPAFLMLPAVLILIGCGDNVAPVKGTVKYKGEAVKGGTITFSPISDRKDPGKGASGKVGDDGTFTLSTHGTGDGAIVGKHKITYTAPAPEAPKEVKPGEKTPPDPPPSPYIGLAPKTPEVEVKAGPNTIEVELQIDTGGGMKPKANK